MTQQAGNDCTTATDGMAVPRVKLSRPTAILDMNNR